MNNETIKEGDYIEYVGRPNEKFLVNGSSCRNFPLCIQTKDGVYFSFNDRGLMFENDTHQIVKKTTPPKKKVLKEFDVYIDNLPILNNHRGTFSMFNTTDREIKAKLICEVEE